MDASAQLTQALINAQSPDATLRMEAEHWLTSVEQQNFVAYATALVTELANPQKDPNIRKLAGILLKNLLFSHDQAQLDFRSQRWLALDSNAKNSIKASSVHTLSDTNESARDTAAQVVAAIAHIELPKQAWPELIPGLLNQMNSADPVKHATLKTLGYIADGMDPQVLETQSNDILTAICRGIRDNNVEVKLAGCGALYNSLEFCVNNFSKENERNYIMQVVCEAAVGQDPRVRAASLECLVQIATLYYETLAPYMQGIFNITLDSISKGPNEVAVQAVEFWSTICDEEIYLAQELEEAQEEERNPEKVSLFFIRGAVKYLVSRLLEALTKQDDEPEEGTWNVATAAGACLSLVSQTVEDEIVQYVMPFVTQNISNPNWKFREAAILSFGCILEGPKNLAPLIPQATPALLERMKDSNVYVKDTTAWTLGKICQSHTPSLGQFLPQVVQVFGTGLDDSPRVAANCCWGLHNIALAFDEESGNNTSVLTQFFLPCLEKLVQVSQRGDADEGNLRTSAYEAINSLISSSAKDTIPFIVRALPVFMDQLSKTFSLREVEEQNELQSHLCSVLQTITTKLEDQIKPFAAGLMQLYLQVFNSKNATVHEETLMAVGALANAVGEEFELFMSSFKNVLLAGLRNFQEYEVCTIAVGVVGDIARALGAKLINYSDEIVNILLQNLQNSQLSRDVKPPILSSFGDLALALGGNFEKYLNPVMIMLTQAAATPLGSNPDDDMIDFLNSLREGIFDAFTGIIQGLRSDNKSKLLGPYVNAIFQFVNVVSEDKNRSDGVTRSCIGTVGDLISALGSDLKAISSFRFLEPLIKDGLHSDNQSTVQIAKWARDSITKLSHQ